MWKYDEVKQQVKEVIEYSQGFPVDDDALENTMFKWQEAKRNFIEAMNGELIYEYPEKVCFELSDSAKKIKVLDFSSILLHRWGNRSLALFVESFMDDFFENITSEDYYVKETGETIKKGTKIIKAFKYFVDNKDTLTDIQNMASQVIQQNCVEGTLCFSVHPLDFLSSSENHHNWRSCHALDGDYRAGNLSYMLDKSTAICYLKGDEEEKFSRFPFKWNSKKWRTLIYFADDWNMIFAGRQYPFSSDVGINIVRTKLIHAALCKPIYSGWHDTSISELSYSDKNSRRVLLRSTYYPVGKCLVAQEDLIIEPKVPLHFNDLLRSTCYKPIYSYREWSGMPEYLDGCGRTRIETTKFHIGSDIKCFCCGKENISHASSFLCESCYPKWNEDEEIYYCDCCGASLREEDGRFVDGRFLCEDCIELYTETCDRCGKIRLKEEIVYSEELNKYICEDCLEEL